MKFLKKLRNFEEGEDLERWLDRFELAVRIDGEEKNEASWLPMFLTGSSYDTWKNLTNLEKIDAKSIKDALRNVYGVTRLQAWRQAKSVIIDYNKNIDAATAEIKKNLKLVIGDLDPTEAFTSMLLLDSLPEELKNECILRLDGNFKLSDLQTIIKRKRDHNENVVAIVGKLQQNKVTRCLGCNREGHIQKNCRVKCFKCGDIGHIRPNCQAALNGRGE